MHVLTKHQPEHNGRRNETSDNQSVIYPLKDPDFLDHVVKKLDQKAKVNFKISFIDWEINYYHANIAQYLTKWNHSNNETCQLIEYSMRIIFLEKSYIVYGWETSPRSFSKKSNLSISLDQDSAQSAQSCTVCFCI